MRSTSEIGIELFDGMHHMSTAVTGRAVPVSELCDILANLEGAGYNLSEMLTRLVGGFERSLCDDEIHNRALRERLVIALARKAADHAQQIALCLEAAHCEAAALATADSEAAPSFAPIWSSRRGSP